MRSPLSSPARTPCRTERCPAARSRPRSVRSSLPRVEAEIALAPRDDGSDVPFADFVPAARLEDDVGHLLLRVWDFQVDGLGRVVQPVEVAVQLEDPAVVGPDPFENAVAVEEAMVEHADLRLGLRVELAVDVNT